MVGTEKTADGVVLSCLKQKDAEPFPPIRLEKVVVALDDVRADDASDDDVIDLEPRTSLVFTPAGLTPSDDNEGIDLLTPSERKALRALVDSPQTWLAWSGWMPLTDIRSKSTFSKAVAGLMRAAYVEKQEQGRASYFRETAEGLEVLKGRPPTRFGRSGEPTPGPGTDGNPGEAPEDKPA